MGLIGARFAETLQSIRAVEGLAQEDLAERMRDAGHEAWRQTTVSKVEAGKRPVTFVEAWDLAKILGHPLGELLDEQPTGVGLDRADARVDEARRAYRDAERRLQAAQAARDRALQKRR